jgi:DNA-binding MarR family transcriptional regulator
MDGIESPGERCAAAARTPPFQGVGFNLSTLGFAVSAGFAERLAPLGLEPRDFGLLRAIGAAEGESQHAIAVRLQIPASRMVAFLDSLERRGLLERRSHPTDRRARALHLTPGGHDLLGRAFEVAAGYERELCAGLDVRERELLLEMLGQVAAAVGVPPGVHAATARLAPTPA